MESDIQLLLDVLHFLRALNEIPLPAMFEASRDELFNRMQTKLSDIKNWNLEHNIQDSSVVADDFAEYKRLKHQPSENFLSLQNNKKLAKGKPFDTGTDKRTKLLSPQSSASKIPTYVLNLPFTIAEEDDGGIVGKVTSNTSAGTFSDMNFSHAKARAHIYGELHREGKLFTIKTLRSFWAALIGWNFLIYDSKGNSKPSQVLFIGDCKCRPVATPKHVPKRLAKSTFEFWYNDNKRFQFTASNPKKMEQWVETVRQWQAKTVAIDSGNANKKGTTKTSKNSPDPDQSWRNSNLSENCADVINDIAVVLANTTKNSKPEPLMKPAKPLPFPEPAASPYKTKAKLVAPTFGNHSLPHYPKIMNQKLPSTPRIPSVINGDNDDAVYEPIDLRNKPKMLQNGNFNNELRQRLMTPPTEKLNESAEQLYDDLANVNEKVEQMTEHNRGKNSTVDHNEIYDDVVAREVNMQRRNENVMREEGKKKVLKKAPKIPVRTTMTKFHTNERNFTIDSSVTTKTKQEQISSSYAQRTARTVMKERISKRSSSSEMEYDYVDKEIVVDQSTYNSERHAQKKNSFAYYSMDNIVESIYDDISCMNLKPGNEKPNAETKLQKPKIAVDIETTSNMFPKQKHFQTLPINHSHKDVFRNLHEQLDMKIDENIHRKDSNEDNSVLHDETEANVDVPAPDNLVGNSTEQIYENKEMWSQIDRDIGQSWQTPWLEDSSKSIQGPPVMAKPFRSALCQELQQVLSSAKKKVITETKFQYQFDTAEKPEPDELVSSNCHQIPSTSDEAIYENLQANR